jgi:hypothetical protein
MTISRAHAVLEEACAAVGLDAVGARLVRVAENETWSLPGRVIVRIAQAGQQAATVREVEVAHWLADHGLPAVRALKIDQPVDIDGHPVTFWEELAEHETGSVKDVVTLIKQLHTLPIPDLKLGVLDPFVRVSDRIKAASSLPENDRVWLQRHLDDLQERWKRRPKGLPECVVHGDAWVGNAVRTAAGPVLLDFERVSVGPPEWDLLSEQDRIRRFVHHLRHGRHTVGRVRTAR